MAQLPSNRSGGLEDLVRFLFSRRDTLLNAWRTACENDPLLTTTAVLSREEFNNLMPSVLDILEQKMLGKQSETDPAVAAQSHGLHRWQKSLGLPELLKELNHLSVILFEEVRLFRTLFPLTEPDILLQAQQQILVLMNETIAGSITKHDELQRLEAAKRAASLQRTLADMEELTLQRSDMLRTVSHDLRGGLGIITGAAYMLKLEDLTEEQRDKFVDMLSRNLTNVQSMLTSLTDLARLEAGQESLQMEEFDAAQLLTELTDSIQATAGEKGIILRADGPPFLVVKTDRLKIYRIAQNLVINALKYTPSSPDHPGLVSISWSVENDWRWGFSVQDSGPGLPNGLMELFHKQLKPTVEETSVLSPEEGQPVASRPNDDQKIPENLKEQSDEAAEKGEGVGLLIVQRLCELVGASLEIETIAGRGTLFRVRMLKQMNS